MDFTDGMGSEPPAEASSDDSRQFLPLSAGDQEAYEAELLRLERRMSPAARRRTDEAFAAFIREARETLRPQ